MNYTTEQVREALMRLTMCARKECEICKYKDRPKTELPSDDCKDRTTKNMNILANVCLCEGGTDKKRMPIKAIMDRFPWAICPSCGGTINLKNIQEYICRGKVSYCEHCGQAIDWSDET